MKFFEKDKLFDCFIYYAFYNRNFVNKTKADSLDKRLVLIEDADENLCIPMSKQVQCGLTQTMLDQIVQDEIGDFMISISGYQPPTKEELQEYEDQEIARNRLFSS